jgi:hypothetical protein
MEISMEFILGRSTEETVAYTALQNFKVHIDKIDPEESYVSFPFSNGTACDLTKTPRSSEIRIYCASDEKRQMMTANQVRQPHFVGDVDEPTTCGYLLKFYTSSLCSLAGFAKQDDVISKIQCVSTATLSLANNM